MDATNAERARSVQARSRLQEKELPELQALASQRYATTGAQGSSSKINKCSHGATINATTHADADGLTGDSASAWARQHGTANRAALSPRTMDRKAKASSGGGGSGGKGHLPLKEVKVPAAVVTLLSGGRRAGEEAAGTGVAAVRTARANAAAAAAATPVPPPASMTVTPRRPHAQTTTTTATSAMSTLFPCATERIGQLQHPLSNIRTAYQDEELRKRAPASVAPPPSLPVAAADGGAGGGGGGADTRSYLPLEMFDDRDGDMHSPEEWVALGAAEGGTPARSRYHKAAVVASAGTAAAAVAAAAAAQGSGDWTACRVLAYDQETGCFEICWEQDGKKKWTRRLNIIFAAESEAAWYRRCQRAEVHRRSAESALRQELYLSVMPEAAVTPFDEDRMDRVIAQVAKKFPLPLLHVVQRCSEEVVATYYRGLKKAVLDYDRKDMQERRRLAAYRLPDEPPAPEPSLRGLCGTINTPSPNFAAVRAFVAGNMFQTHSLVYETLHQIHTLWFDYKSRPVCLSDFNASSAHAAVITLSGGTGGVVEPPMRLDLFVEAQLQRGTSVSEKLRGEWSSTVQSAIQNNLDPHFNFYEDNVARYQTSRMARFVKLVNTMMATQLRELLVDSIERYATFVCSYRVGGGGVVAAPAAIDDVTKGSAHVEKDDGSGDAAAADDVMDELPWDTAEHARWQEQRTALIAKMEAAAEAELVANPQSRVARGTTAATAASSAGRADTSKPAAAAKKRKSDTTTATATTATASAAAVASTTASLADTMAPDRAEDGSGSSAAASYVPYAWRLGVHTPAIPFTKRVVNLTMHPNGLQPLFQVRLVEDREKGTVCFQPPLEDVAAQVRGVFERCNEYCGGVCGMGDQLFPLLEMTPTYLVPIDWTSETVICDARDQVAATLEEALAAPRQLQHMYKEFEYMLTTNVESACAAVVAEDLSQDELDLVFDRLTRDLRRISERTPDTVKYELFAVNCADLKALLTRRGNALLTGLQDVLAKRLMADCNSVIASYEELHERLSIDPTTPEELQDLRAYLDGVLDRESAIQRIFTTVTAGNDLLLSYLFLVSDEEFVRYWLAYEWPKKLQQFCEDRTFRCKEHRTVFMQALRDNSDKLSFDIMQLAAHVEDFSHMGEDARADEFAERAREISALIETYQAQATLFVSHEELFGMATSQYPQLKEIRAHFEPYHTLWHVASAFQAETDRWTTTRISALQPGEVDQKVSDWGKKVALVAKKIKEPEPSEVCKRLRDSIERFKPNIPLLYALRSNLQASHWRAIYAAAGIPKERQGFGAGGVDNNDQRPLTDFLKLGMLDYMTPIETISQVAQKTFELEAELMTMESEWKKLLFDLEPYQDTFKLKANETMQLALDEHLLKTQSMLGKPIVRQAPALQARVSHWERQLDNIQCSLDEWFRCQNTWAYLEPIFSSADISRSLPTEKRLFVEVDDAWHCIMEQTKATPQVLTRCQDDGLLRVLTEANDTLEVVLRKLQLFLETKRMAFPRFYFISNEELLQILSDSKDPQLVQPYLCKCFEGINRIQFARGGSHEIVGMTSPEGEEVPFIKAVKPSDFGNQVELWLQAVETVMKDSMRDQLKQAIGDYATRKRTDFIRAWPGQVVIAICSLFWTMEATAAMEEEGTVGLTSYHEKCVSQLDDLILLVRDKNLGAVQRCTLEALVVIEVHAKDIIGMLCDKGVDSPTSFDWLSQLRYYWEGDHLIVNQINASLRYGYEYLGNTGRLVITPLTDRCYRTLIGALHLNYGGAPEGPAGTGKTETTKDLAKALGKYCVVYNCSDQITAKDMAKLFKGLTQAGAWGCFDEFNRIEIQVLSVIAQQVATIQDAIVQKRTEFIFEGAQIKMDPGCAIFITMNPGYAGRAELPDNLKALFRPVAMMVPNYAMIGEIQLYSYGFLHGKVLSEKIVATYRLCSEQLSSQDHYDYGMRAVKAVLTAAGRLKRQFPDEDEMILMLRSIQDVNLPKFLSQDVGLFKGIISDLFPGVTLPDPDYAEMHAALAKVSRRRNLQLTEYFEEKIRQTYEMICVRHGMMIVGYSYGGKTKALQCLAEGLTEMSTSSTEPDATREHRTRLVTINPKSVTMAHLYGRVEQSGEWTDGVLSVRFRQLAQDTSPDRKWLVLDGPVDAVWIENMNTVLDDNKKLCLQNGDIIPMSKTMNLIFEVQDLAHASPATVSRCGMVYVEPETLGWRCLMDSYVNTLPEYLTEHDGEAGDSELVASFKTLTALFMEDMLEFVCKRTKTVIPQGASTAVASFTKLFASFAAQFDEEAALAACAGDSAAHPRCMKIRVEGWFIFSLVWSVGGCLFTRDRIRFSEALHTLLAAKTADYKFALTLPERAVSFYDMKLEDSGAAVRFAPWQDSVPELTIPEGSEYQDIIVPTTETTKYTYLLNLMVASLHPTLLVGDTGTGKTIMMKALLRGLSDEAYRLNFIQFSAQTTAGHLQRLVDGTCEKRRKGIYGPPINKSMMIFIDDCNLPQLEEYGAQPPIELLRQYLDHGGWYSLSKEGIEFRQLVDSLLLCAMGPAGGGRNPLTARFTRHFNALSVPSFDEATLKTIYGRLTEWILSRGFPSNLRAMSTPLVGATVELYEVLVENLKPSPEKSHYTFNMRDVSKVFQGIDMAHAPRITDDKRMAELWMHEVWRAFADRFIDDQDNQWFAGEAGRICNKFFKVSVSVGGAVAAVVAAGGNTAAVRRRSSLARIGEATTEPPLLFTSVTNEEGNYEKVANMHEARQILESKLEMYNIQSRTGDLNLVVFGYVLEHVTRISRVMRQPGGNLLLVGVGGSGRRSCTKLAAYLLECDYSTVAAVKDYDHSDFLDDIRGLLLKTGQKGYSTAFVLSDSEISSDAFLEDICSLLNSGEVPGLWDTKQDRETYENAVATLRDVGKGLGRPDTQEALQTLFLERCRKHMHIVLCFSPLGSVLRERLRKFPSLVNCTTIDWFREWPEDGLRSVATRFLRDLDLTDAEKVAIREMFVTFQQQVRDMGAAYLSECRQHTYVTPTSYLDLLGTFARLLQAKRSELTARRQRYVNGLLQLKKTEDQVEVMQRELEVMRPELAIKQSETDTLIAEVQRESTIAEQQQAIVAVDEAAANEQAASAKAIKDASQEKVDEAQPLVEQAERAVQDLDPKALQEIKALKTPPQGVKYVIEVLCTLLGGVYKPKATRDPLTGKTNAPYWEHAKLTLLTGEFKNVLLTSYPVIVDSAPDSQIEEVKKKMSNDMFKMENIRKTSVALIGVALYIKAVVEYYKQNKVIKPLLAQAAAAQAKFDEAMFGLNKKKEELRVISEKLKGLTDHLAKVNADKQELEDKVNDTDTKLTRAKKLIEGLGGEKTRFAKEAERFGEELKYVVGNVVVSAGAIAYLGPFLHKYRQQAVTSWARMCRLSGILVSDDFSLEAFCGDPVDIQRWKLQQLPSDSFSVVNAVIMRASSRWPLLVDPQQQANAWIRNLERDNGLIVVRPSEADFLRTIRAAITAGGPVLLENLEETIDPMLDNLLLKHVTREGAMRVMHLGEPVEWNDNFRFYMTTKLPRPHYLPEVSTKVTLINFMITEQGLCDQLLQRVMMSERRDVEEKKQAMTLEAAANQAGLKDTEDRILAILSAEGNILESEEAIQELDSSKEQSDRIAKRQEEIEAMERISDRTRNQFVPVAHLGAILFFCVTELANVDPMYQNSLQFYISVFQEALANSKRSSDVPARIEAIGSTFKTSLFQRICRSLFAKDQLLFSFIMSLKMFAVDPALLRWLLMGGFEGDDSGTTGPDGAIAPFEWLPVQNWKMLRRASAQLNLLSSSSAHTAAGGNPNDSLADTTTSSLGDNATLLSHIKSREMFFRDYYEASNPLELELPAPLNALTIIEKMVIVRCLRTDKIVPAVRDYVRETLGEFFVQAPLFVLETVVDELAYDPSIPVILVLSPGADPNAELDRVAELKGMLSSKLFKLSLGQGQDVPAKELIETGMAEGHWVLLQNCHLYEDFMPTLSRIIETYSDATAKHKLHVNYRLWLTSLPSETFPIAILQNGVKLVQEPPKGLQNNLLQSYLSDPVADADFFGSSNKPEVWHKLLFGLCFFHAVAQERRQYGPLGWNRPYEFNDTDRRISIRQLNMFLNENDATPYDALLYLVGQCNYGGRVTDDWDRRCLMSTLQVFFTPMIHDDDYTFNEDADEYYAPPFGEYQTYVDYIRGLPQQQPPSIFGLHENADITKDERDARFLLDATLSTQPRESTAAATTRAVVGLDPADAADPAEAAAAAAAAAAALDPKVMVKQLAADVLARLPDLFDVEEVQRLHPILYEQSMNTVLLQEAIRYNRLLEVVRRSLAQVQDAISGKVVMSSELEQVYNNIFDGKVPELWKRRSYPSLKPLGAYVTDLVARLDFLRRWCDEGPPAMFWLSGFFFTQSFLTGIMQNYARKHHIEIDKLVWDFSVMAEDTFAEAPEEGCYVYGLFLEGAGWEDGVLCESRPKELFLPFPTMRLLPIRPEDAVPAPIYHCPCYKTTDRRGVLSTTGHSTNFILTVDLPRDQEDENHWILRGTALFTQLDY